MLNVCKIKVIIRCKNSSENMNSTADEQTIIRADLIVVCGGVGSYQLADMLGDTVNVYPVRLFYYSAT